MVKKDQVTNGKINKNSNIEDDKINSLCKFSILNTFELYTPQTPISTATTPTNGANNNGDLSDESRKIKIYSKIKDEYEPVKDLPTQSFAKKAAATNNNKQKTTTDKPTIEEEDTKDIDNIINNLPSQKDEKRRKIDSNAISLYNHNVNKDTRGGSLALVNGYEPLQYTKPDWHAPWKLMRVVSGHTGWVRAIAVDASNQWFATGGGDNTIKVWDLASGELKVTLTGHVSQVRGLAISARHPYLFSVGDDAKVLCWDLECNKQIRSYYGHHNAVNAVALHPTLDILFSGGRDKDLRVWDMRTKAKIFEIRGHSDAITSIAAQNADPQVITGSNDQTVRLWDLASGTCAATLTNHKKSVRALAVHEKEFTFASASADNIKQWKCPDGTFIKNLSGHNAIVNALALNQDNVLVSAADNGSMQFWDWKTGHCFQKNQSIVQPGSLDSEAGIFAMSFDKTGTRLITCEADKTIKFYKEDENASEATHPVVDWRPSRDEKRY
ncbi:hypothetical protein CYY_000711 [Polysphondylium violaceum]|uniref:WD40 repeat-containing protein n=1 Tax=Polysphondylium violaceum TaxID=133409 RepID=A0A8J4V8N4_9MYCE|nr:hypothetical protein CYY_000711 [Polysphondylium violaceum]